MEPSTGSGWVVKTAPQRRPATRTTPCFSAEWMSRSELFWLKVQDSPDGDQGALSNSGSAHRSHRPVFSAGPSRRPSACRATQRAPAKGARETAEAPTGPRSPAALARVGARSTCVQHAFNTRSTYVQSTRRSRAQAADGLSRRRPSDGQQHEPRHFFRRMDVEE